jgi:ATP-dependent DNA helicase RecG
VSSAHNQETQPQQSHNARVIDQENSIIIMTIEELLEALKLGEDQDLEFKAAQGGLPRSAWETVSAFANTTGGTIVLGVAERDGKFEIVGVNKPQTLIKDFWDTHNSPQKINYPICRDSDVTALTVGEHTVICIQIPQASRQQRPIYINGNPIGGTFKRKYEGDYRCTEAEVRQMLRDAAEDPADGRILEGFTIEDLDAESLMAYRNRFASRSPDHPFLAKSDRDLLESLGGWRRDRLSNIEGITLAGLLMFGKERSILDALPHFHIDYQEQFSTDPEVRWTYRLTIDGKWTPNLFNFYYRVYPRLVENIGVPFKLDKNATRLEETHVHEAIREAFVNTLIHADHQTTHSISIINRHNEFLFINPGRLRISLDQLYQGGVSDPRNPNLLKMFQMLGLVERAGSGFEKILRAWREQLWFKPLVAENLTLELTQIQLPVVSMVPESVEQELRLVVGEAYQTLDELEKTILMLAHHFGEIGNKDIQQHRNEHSKDIGDLLRKFVAAGWLNKDGQGSGSRYQWPNVTKHLLPDSSEHLPSSSEHLNNSLEHLPDSSEHLGEEQEKQLLQIALPVQRAGKKVSKAIMEEIILALCAIDWLTLRTLARLLDRKPDYLRNHFIAPMLKDGRLELKMPGNPSHPKQAYRKTGLI